MKYLISFCASMLLSIAILSAQTPSWSTASQPWPESFGSQRAVIDIKKAAGSVEIDLLWRRHDKNPDERRFLIIEAATGDTIKNIDRNTVTAERCNICFGPVMKPGKYYFYYLPFEVVDGWGYYGKGYLKKESAPDTQWLNQYPRERAVKANILGIECRTAFDNFFPMEIIPTQKEKAAFLKKNSNPVLFFTETREFPIRMKDEIPLKWIESGTSEQFTGNALQNEYYSFQIGVFAATGEISRLEVLTSNLTISGKSGEGDIRITCFNTQGVDPYGVPFTKKLNIASGGVQALWIGADVPKNARPGRYTGHISIIGKDMPSREITITLNVSGQLLADRGDSEPWRHSRLRWLNSTAGSEGIPVPPYLSVKQTGSGQIELAHHQLHFGKNGLPESIDNQSGPLLASPVTLTAETPDGILDFPFTTAVSSLTDGKYTQLSKSKKGNIESAWSVRADYDGYLHTFVTFKNISQNNPVTFKDIKLSIPMVESQAKYMMGMGLPGCAVPVSHESKWKGPFDSFWFGDADGGIWCELRGSTYHGPLLNLYHPAPPESWNNSGKGGFRITRSAGRVTAEVYSGDRILNPGDSIRFEWSLLITPVKKLNPVSQFTDRYYHTGAKPTPEKADFDAGVKIVNIHHANEYNPFINYPFIAVKEMRSIVDDLHAKGIKVKIYYTVRELTNHVTEVWALRSLGYEILDNGRGGGYTWLREHFIDGYTPQWYQHFPDGRVDASVLSSPGDSRWLNYYIEGLSWLVKNVDIDGLYLDDVTFDRRILQRMRSVMAQAKPGCLIDLHSNTGFSIGPANQYTEFFPYVDKLWFGESFQYDKMSAENWLVEVSGIPFGLMGDMLQGGGNRWLGMVFGMTVRYPWTTEGILCDPKPVWKIWDEFKIQDARMTGFWNSDCPVKTDIPEIKATAYIKPGKTLISIGNFSDRTQYVNLQIDWKALGLDPNKCRVRAPEIENFQPATAFDLKTPIPVEPRKGWLIYLEEK